MKSHVEFNLRGITLPLSTLGISTNDVTETQVVQIGEITFKFEGEMNLLEYVKITEFVKSLFKEISAKKDSFVPVTE